MIYFYVEIATPLEKSHPPLSQQTPSKSWGSVKPLLFENSVGGSTPPPLLSAEWGGGGVHTILMLVFLWGDVTIISHWGS